MGSLLISRLLEGNYTLGTLGYLNAVSLKLATLDPGDGMSTELIKRKASGASYCNLLLY